MFEVGWTFTEEIDMFGNLFKSKKSDDEVTMSLIVLTHNVQTSLKKSYFDYLQSTNSSDKFGDVNQIGLFSLGLFLVTSQFLMNSKRSNKTDLLDYYTNSMIKDFIKSSLSEDGDISEDMWKKFVPMYQDFYSNLGSRFSSFLENPSPSNEFSIYYLSKILGSGDLMTQLYFDRVIALNIKEIREYIQNELN